MLDIYSFIKDFLYILLSCEGLCGIILQKEGFEMTFKKGYYLGYLIFVFAIAIVYFIIPPQYGFRALITLTILFCLYQFFLYLKGK